MIKVTLFVLMFLMINVSPADDQAQHLFQQGMELNQQGQLIDASVKLTEAISLDNTQAVYYYQRALSFEGMGQIPQSMNDYNAAVGLKTKELNAYLKLINYHRERFEYLAALVITDQLIAHLPEQAAGTYYDKGMIYETMGRIRLAVESYEKMLVVLDPEMLDFKSQVRNRIKLLKNKLEK